MNIRQATIQDLPLLAPLAADLIKQQHLPFNAGGTKALEGFKGSFLKGEDGVCFIAEGDGKVVGWIGAVMAPYMFSEDDMCHVRAWDVHPGYRASGIGGKLLHTVMGWAKEKAIKFITVGVNIDSSPNPEFAFTKLQNLGFKELERFFIREI